jgi:hypothetical protein
MFSNHPIKISCRKTLVMLRQILCADLFEAVHCALTSLYLVGSIINLTKLVGKIDGAGELVEDSVDEGNNLG